MEIIIGTCHSYGRFDSTHDQQIFSSSHALTGLFMTDSNVSVNSTLGRFSFNPAEPTKCLLFQHSFYHATGIQILHRLFARIWQNYTIRIHTDAEKLHREHLIENIYLLLFWLLLGLGRDGGWLSHPGVWSGCCRVQNRNQGELSLQLLFMSDHIIVQKTSWWELKFGIRSESHPLTLGLLGWYRYARVTELMYGNVA